MKLNQLRDLVAVVEHGSLRAAARELKLAQPLLTRSVRSLERELGVTLFERGARGMTVTPLGRLFHQRASAVLHELRRARDEVAQAAGGHEGELNVALSIMPHVGMLPAVLPLFRERYPRVRLQITEGLFPNVEAMLRNGALDFYLGAAPQTPPAAGLVMRKLFGNTRAVFARKGHPLAGASSLRALADAEWATTLVDYDADQDLKGLFARRKLPPPQIVLRAGSALSMMVSLTSTDMLALLPVQWAEFPLTSSALVRLQLNETLLAPDIVLVQRPDLPLTPAAEYFCDLMERQAPPAPRKAGRAKAASRR